MALDGRIDLVVKGARDIRAADFGNQSDAYCKVGVFNLNLKKGWINPPAKSKVVTSLTPMWNLPFSFVIKCDEPCEVHIKVYDHDKIGAHDLLGSYTLHPQTMRAELVEGKKITKAFVLHGQGETTHLRGHGFVDVELKYSADPSPAAAQRRREVETKALREKEAGLRKAAEKTGKKYIADVDFEKFNRIQDLPQTFRAFIKSESGLYLRVKPGREAPIIGKNDPVDERQVWEISFIGDSHILLKNLVMNKYVTAEKWATTIGDVTCRCTSANTFERWELFPSSGEANNFSIRSYHNRFLAISAEGVCRADVEKPGPTTTLHFEAPPKGAVAMARAKFLNSPYDSFRPHSFSNPKFYELAEESGRVSLKDEPWPYIALVILIILVDIVLRIF